jgi:hypothetical protein
MSELRGCCTWFWFCIFVVGDVLGISSVGAGENFQESIEERNDFEDSFV